MRHSTHWLTFLTVMSKHLLSFLQALRDSLAN